MAKIDWSKHNYRVQRGEALRDLPAGGLQRQFYKESGLWTLSGKYYGTHIHNLPLHYLNWLIDNFQSGSYRQQAEDELYRRYAELNSNT